jgi:hypothetical protein
MAKEMYEIETCECKADYDNGCQQPSNGGQYTAENALRILENGNGGSMRSVKTGKGYCVSYERSKNDWLRKLLKIK